MDERTDERDEARRARRARRKSEWRENLAIAGIVIVDAAIAIPVLIVVQTNTPEWDAPLVFVSLALAAMPILWYWRVRRHGWIVAFVASVFVALSFGFALAHGWIEQVVIVYALASVVFMIGMTNATIRFSRVYSRMMREIDEEINGDPHLRTPVLFRDDGQQIIAYPRRLRLIPVAILQMLLLAGTSWGLILLKTQNLIASIALGLVACLALWGFLGVLSRLLVRRPSLVVGPDGILENAIFFGSGTGLLHWDEILAVYPTVEGSPVVKYRYLAIAVIDYPALRRRQPLLKRLVLSTSFLNMSRVLIPQWMLETPVDELTQQIDHYIETHAPPGWRDRDEDAPGESSDGGKQE